MALLWSEISRKKNGSRTKSSFVIWMWCTIILLCLFSLPCGCSGCQGVEYKDDVLWLYPEGTVTVRYGDPVELLCVSEDSNTSKFALGGKTIPSEIVNATTRRLYIEKPEKGMHTYYCYYKKKRCTSRVLIDSPPSDVKDFACISKNIEVLNCTWTSSQLHSLTNYTLNYAFHGLPVRACLANLTDSKLRHCVFDTQSTPRYLQMEDKYSFHLHGCNIFGCNEQYFVIDHFAIVKPDPPIGLKILTTDPHSISLRWSVPNNIAHFLSCGVEHKIEYQIAKIDNTSYFRRVNSSSLPANNKTYNFQLTDLPYAHMRYEVRIYIRPTVATSDKFWSDFAYIVFYTDSERPQNPPDTVTGAFDQTSFEGKRRVYIYWKQLEEYEEAGPNFGYNVSVMQKGRNLQTLQPYKNTSMSYVILEEASLDALDVFIWSLNGIGSSINSSHLYIPSKRDTESLKVTDFTKVANVNGTYELSWFGIKNIDNYTLFWCQHNSTKVCTGRMNFTVLNPNKTKYVIELPNNNRYQFAISANNGSMTSGMVWASCDISRDSNSVYVIPVKLDHDIPGKSYVKLTWKMSCTLPEDAITGYRISYCPAFETSNSCDRSQEIKRVSTKYPKQTEMNITSLEPYTTYLFTLEMNTTKGLKPIENASTSVTTIEDTPTSPINVAITDIKNDSLVISWDPPLHSNGIIGKYVISNYSDEIYVLPVSRDKTASRIQVNLTGLQAFTNNSFTVQACNAAIRSCSKIEPNDGIFVRTPIGPPHTMKAPAIKNNPDKIAWEQPEPSWKTVDLYQIRIIKDDSNPEIINVSSNYLSYAVSYCIGVTGAETYQIRAINYDEDDNHGALAYSPSVILPKRYDKDIGHRIEYPGQWSEPSTVACRGRDGLTVTFILMSIFALIGILYGSIKYYKRYRKMEDIKPVLPSGLGIPEKDNSKYAFSGWNPTTKDDKPSSDEMLLLPNSRTTVSCPETKQKENDNCGSSDHTDSTALSDGSRGPIDRQVSSSDDGSGSSLHLEVETVRVDDNNATQDEDSCNSDTEMSRENSPYFNDRTLKKNPTSGYVQNIINNIGNTGYVQSAQEAVKNPPINLPAPQPAGSSYVMASLPPPIFTTGVAPPTIATHSPPSSGYIRPEEAQARSGLSFPMLGPSPTKLFGPESLPTLPTLPSTKHAADSSYIQLQSLDALPSQKQTIRNHVPLKTPVSRGYVSPGDAVINKHLNILSANQLVEEPAILDPTMSPDAYCRFSWSTDPTNDNLHSLLADSTRINTSKN
ncbi:hypothetical protein K1T71_007034 [Dendrolimus kikuchii]|uniref:Uncharacterized protein n=1 Tax=Dendrolimus kikuchii TaxID=765133 RepID=A0ACC1CZM7_9NEOP|nr:hypothetical protein K1T71_007034 [Dendrolimus kikuchii]